MPEAKQITFTHKEVVTALLKEQGIHEGIWAVHVRFGLRALNIGTSEHDLLPAVLIPVLEIGITRVEKENNLAVDASKVNAKSRPKKSAKTAKHSVSGERSH